MCIWMKAFLPTSQTWSCLGGSAFPLVIHGKMCLVQMVFFETSECQTNHTKKNLLDIHQLECRVKLPLGMPVGCCGIFRPCKTYASAKWLGILVYLRPKLSLVNTYLGSENTYILTGLKPCMSSQDQLLYELKLRPLPWPVDFIAGHCTSVHKNLWAPLVATWGWFRYSVSCELSIAGWCSNYVPCSQIMRQHISFYVLRLFHENLVDCISPVWKSRKLGNVPEIMCTSPVSCVEKCVIGRAKRLKGHENRVKNVKTKNHENHENHENHT